MKIGVLACVFLLGCASVDESYLLMTCAIIETGSAQFEGSPQRFPSMKLVCEKVPE